MEPAVPGSIRQFDAARGSWSSMDFQRRGFDRRLQRKTTMRIGFLVPFSGADAIWGPSGQYSAVLAAAKINALGGVRGREIELFAADAGGSPDKVVARVAELLNVHQVEALAGVHMSNVRIAIRNALGRQVPYVYATQYEGGETARGLFPIGETPVEQYRDAITWMVNNQRAKRWYLLGNDYVWPWETHRTVSKLINDAGGEIVGIDYVPLGERHHKQTLKKIKAARPDILFETLVGSDCVTFNQTFGQENLSRSIMRLSGVIEENVLMGIGPEFSKNLYAVSGYFNSLQTAENRQFLREYKAAFGDNAPMQGGMSQACYESIICLASLAEKAKSLDVNDMAAVGHNCAYFGARGHVKITEDRTLMDYHLMRSNGLEYEPVRAFPTH